MRLFRAVGGAELADITNHNRLRPGPPSHQGKWMATTLADANTWGNAMKPWGGPFAVVELEVPDDRVAELHCNPRLDGIGAAYFAEPGQLGMIQVVGVRDDRSEGAE